jgi:hypothetical protein
MLTTLLLAGPAADLTPPLVSPPGWLSGSADPKAAISIGDHDRTSMARSYSGAIS